MSKIVLLGAALLGAATANTDTVCVTGGNGYIATELVKQLLEVGYSVQTTVRSLETTDYRHLLKLDEALPGTLSLSQADLMVDGSFDECASGASVVFHTASPFHFGAIDSESDMISPAVKGTKTVVDSAKRGGATRVVLTSSFAAVNSFTPEDKPSNGALYTEGDWNEFTTEETYDGGGMQAYVASKALAEQAAVQATRELGLELVVINPVLVLGPVVSGRKGSVSIDTGISIANGNKMPFEFPLCDVRDVARAHIEGMTSEQGRYIISHPDVTGAGTVFDLLSESFPEHAFEAAEGGDVPMIDNAKARALLGELIPLKQTLADMARSLYATALATPKRKGEGEKGEL